MKYKPLTDPITRREAATILPVERVDALRVAGMLDVDKLPSRTAPLMFRQEQVRAHAEAEAAAAVEYAKQIKQTAKLLSGPRYRGQTLKRRDVTELLGKTQTGILIRSGKLEPVGRVDSTRTAAHVYDAAQLAAVVEVLAAEAKDKADRLVAMSKAKVPAQ